MYEIWLMLVIVWELMLSSGTWLWAAAGVWLALMAVGIVRHGVSWQRGAVKAAGLGVLTTVVAFFVLPGMVASSMGELRYWVDWLALAGMAIGIGAAVAVFTWPVWTTLSRRPARTG
ncbi:hypothetical protein GTZ97_08555 [Aquabacterium fontiphilum]|jgi:hypothetical protein|uniref:hypothetical protein n=1 Tax=Aquabacterium fontiphilum TaxID=450365 RepID=UPI0013784B13|nr:hypothetical protein [Aquabacterium fontiphilum]NBD20717.1 hypothetical protein [Aquabacterium fontiphilum]